MSINPTKCQARAKEMSLAVYNGAAIQGGEAAARARLLRKAQSMQGHAEVETGPRDGGVGGERSW